MSTAAARPPPRLPACILIALAVGLVVVGARWQLIERLGSPVPFQDQWYAEAEDLYLAEARGGVPPARFLQAHNDHRIAPTRALAFVLFKANHQWDVRLQMTFNALLAAAVVFPLLLLLRPWLPSSGLALVGALLAWLLAQPLLYENALWGFQSGFYLLILVSLGHLLLVLGRPERTVGWWIGVAAGLLALVTLGSGLLAPLAAALVAGLRCWREPAQRRHLRWTLAAAALLVILGACLQPPRLASAHPLTPTTFFATLGHVLSFPDRSRSFGALLVWAPFAGMAALLAFRRRPWTTSEGLVIAAGSWVLLQSVAISYARPETGPVIANRYGDILTVGLVVNVAAIAWTWMSIGRRSDDSNRPRPAYPEVAAPPTSPTFLSREGRIGFRVLLLGGTIGWLALVGHHGRLGGQIVETYLAPMMRALRSEQTERIRDFYHGQTARIADAAYPHIPVFNAPSLVRDLGFPEIAAIMPFELRNPIPLSFPSAPGGLANAVPDSLPNQPGALHRGTFLPGSGAAGTGSWTSAPAHKDPHRGLAFSVAGEFQPGETELRIRDGAGNVRATITHLNSATLHPVVVDVPGDTFTVEVVDRSATRWIAFLEPTEIGPLSALTLRVLPSGARIERAGWFLLVVLAGFFSLELLRGHLPNRQQVATAGKTPPPGA